MPNVVAGTGTFGRVCLCREKPSSKYYAMKILSINDVIRLKQVEHVKSEKNILQQVRHPFIVNMWVPECLILRTATAYLLIFQNIHSLAHPGPLQNTNPCDLVITNQDIYVTFSQWIAHKCDFKTVIKFYFRKFWKKL